MAQEINRKRVVLYGRANAGKSSLFNALMGQRRALVSDVPGTTADPVDAVMELLPHGPIVLTDTAGLLDASILGAQREAAARAMLSRTDVAVYVSDAATPDDGFANLRKQFEAMNIPYVVAFSKADLCGDVPYWAEEIKHLRTSVYDEASINTLRGTLAEMLSDAAPERGMLEGLLPDGGVVLLVVSIDAGAPKGRLILPQVQCIRDAVDRGLTAHVTDAQNLPAAVSALTRIDLAVADSAVFAQASAALPEDVPLTSFSILTARQKGDIQALHAGVQAIEGLRDGDRVFIAEACTHNRSHEDIGRVKVPRALEQISGAKLTFEFAGGRDFTEDISPYALVVHCGGCMMSARAFQSRQIEAAQKKIPMTNYGMVLAKASGVLRRAINHWGSTPNPARGV
jgi:[FeFe] hydrogenase H-cluster maturation GTPase HydF